VVIEIDTDGVYFTAPTGCTTDPQRTALVEKISEPARRHHNRARLLSGDAQLQSEEHAAGPRWRSNRQAVKEPRPQPALHDFIAYSLSAILRGNPELIDNRYRQLRQMIEHRSINIRELAKTETLIESLDTYRQGGEAQRNRAAAYEVREPPSVNCADQVTYYITGDRATIKGFEAAKPIREFDTASPDYNVKYYLRKLDQNHKKVQGYSLVSG
jgi:DNA polymerase elongation subunit (family B)